MQQVRVAFLAAALAAAVPFVNANCEVCGCDDCPEGEYPVTNPGGIFAIPPEYQEQALGRTEITCSTLEVFGSNGFLPDELCTDTYRLIEGFRELCGCPDPPMSKDATKDDDVATDDLAFDLAPPCPRLLGCYLENTVRHEEIVLTGTDQYTVLDDESRHEWTVRCDFDSDPDAVTFFYFTDEGQRERVERTPPYYMGGDENGVADGVDFLGECGDKSFDVAWETGDSCSNTDFFAIEALCGFDIPMPPTRAPVPAPIPHPVAPVAPTTPAPTDATCIRFNGCYLENAFTGYMRKLELVDSYDIYEDESKWYWTVRCDFHPTPGAVTFYYPTAEGSMDMVEFHEPFYMGGDMPDGTPKGVNPFLSDCGEKTFQVIGDTSGCHSNKISYTLNAICDPYATPVAPPTMPPAHSPCYAADLVLSKASSILDAFTHKFARKSDRYLKKKKSGSKKSHGEKEKSEKSEKQSNRSKNKDDNHNSRDDDDDDDSISSGRPIDLSFDFVTTDDHDCELNIGAHLKIDTVLFGLPIKLDGEVALSGLAIADAVDKTLCVGSVHVNSFDIFGLSKFLLHSLEHDLGMDVPHFIEGILGDKVCL